MTTIYVYVESTKSLGFQFVPFKTELQAKRFMAALATKSKTLTSTIWKPLN